MKLSRRDFLKISSIGGLVFSTGLSGARAFAHAGGDDEFYFVQLSDSHWGFKNLKFNGDPEGTLPKAIATVNSLARKPDFVMFTGDLTHTTDDPEERRRRMRQFKSLTDKLEVPQVRYLPGEHDAALDAGAAYKEFFGDTHYAFSHKGVNFIALDNVSDPRARLGATQLGWLEERLAELDRDQPLVVFAHRPLFALRPDWDWSTADGDQAIALLKKHPKITVFYGHIHQEHHHQTGHIAHHSAKSLIFPLAPPDTQGKKFKVGWDPQHPYAGLGLRKVGLTEKQAVVEIDELGVKV